MRHCQNLSHSLCYLKNRIPGHSALNGLIIISPKLLYNQIPDHRVLKLLVKIHPVIDIGQKDKQLLQFNIFEGDYLADVSVKANVGLDQRLEFVLLFRVADLLPDEVCGLSSCPYILMS